jgi:hypothetical protein
LLAGAPALEGDPAAHALNELAIYRALVVGSGIWPAAWLVNAFWAPLRDINALFAPAVSMVRADFQPLMTRLLDLVEDGHETEAVTLVADWFAVVDRDLVRALEAALVGSGDNLDKTRHH